MCLENSFKKGGEVKLKEIYELAVSLGIKTDPRGQMAVKRILKKAKDDYKRPFLTKRVLPILTPIPAFW